MGYLITVRGACRELIWTEGFTLTGGMVHIEPDDNAVRRGFRSCSRRRGGLLYGYGEAAYGEPITNAQFLSTTAVSIQELSEKPSWVGRNESFAALRASRRAFLSEKRDSICVEIYRWWKKRKKPRSM